MPSCNRRRWDRTKSRFPINLATALRLSDARPLIVATAQARIWVAEAELTKAKVLWVPDLNIGSDYIRHDGGGPDFNKGIMTAPSTNFFYGGAGLWGTSMDHPHDRCHLPAPGGPAGPQLPPLGHPGRQERRPDPDRRRLLPWCTSTGGCTPAPSTCVERGHDLVERIAALSRDLVQAFEVDRARNMVADLEQQAVSARQQWRVAERQAHPGAPARPPRGGRAARARPPSDHPDRPGRDARRPDADRPDQPPRGRLAAGAGPGGGGGGPPREGAPAHPRRRAQRLPDPRASMLQAGIFGIGPNSSLNQWTGRDDFSFQPLWQLKNLGFGNLARIKEQRGSESLAIIDSSRPRTGWRRR